MYYAWALFFFKAMRYFYEKPTEYYARYGRTYFCDHPVYGRCTLYLRKGRGLAVIQQRFNAPMKTTYWSELDPWLVDDIYMQNGFKEYFDKHSGKESNGLYPTVTVRKIMWALRMKPLKKYRWETVFDRQEV